MRQLIKEYPAWAWNIPEFVALQAAYSSLTEQQDDRWTDILTQCDLDTATWGLDLWEDRLSLPTDHALSYAARRARIRTRLAQSGPINAAYLAELASSIVGEPVTAIEHNPEAWVAFQWGHPGYPDNLAAMLAAILDVIPAHMEPVFTPFWARWQDIHDGELTWGEADDMTWAELMRYEVPDDEPGKGDLPPVTPGGGGTITPGGGSFTPS